MKGRGQSKSLTVNHDHIFVILSRLSLSISGQKVHKERSVLVVNKAKRAWERGQLASVMPLVMLAKPRGRGKSLATIGTSKRLDVEMTPLMLLQQSFGAERFGALVTRKRKLACVPSFMHSQIGQIGISCIAIGARKSLFGPRMKLGMLLQNGVGDEAFAADVAEPRLVPGMSQQMRLQMNLLDEALVAKLALMPAIIGMNPGMLSERRGRGEGSTAMKTHMISRSVTRRYIAVNSLDVVIDLRLLLETFAALDGTIKRFFSRMNKPMLFQGRL